MVSFIGNNEGKIGSNQAPDRFRDRVGK